MLGWELRVRFQIVAFQAVMAQQLNGDTIHHTCGIPVCTNGRRHSSVRRAERALVRRLLAAGSPGGGFLAGIPTEFIRRARECVPAPTLSHGQAPFWGGGDGGIQGVTELKEVERGKDTWLQEVQEELRHGRLSEGNWNCLHGRATSVPGSWSKGWA